MAERRFKLIPQSTFAQVLWGLVLGIFCGLFFGESAGSLGIFGDAYVRLLQMTVVPYVLVSLVGGLGRLDVHHAKQIGSQGGGLILFLWAIALIVLLALPMAYPDWDAGAFFSTTEKSAQAEFDPLLLYLPANPFFSLANTILPAVVVFSILMGAALITVPEKAGLLQALDNLTRTLMKITNWVVKLSPLGIFAIAANAAGTIRPEALGKLQVYLWVYLGAWLMLTFLVLPALVSRATPLSFRDVLRTVRTPFITSIATGSVLVVLPMMAESCKALLEKRGLHSDDSHTTVDVLVPTAYSFPSVGTLLGLGFILFAAWYVGSPLGVDQYPGFTIMGLLSAFGQMAVALPFLLDLFRLPADLFQLYLLGSVMTGRLATGLAAMHGVVVSLLGACALLGILSWRKLLEVAAVGIAATAFSMWVVGFVLTVAIPYEYKGEDMFVSMRIDGEKVPAASRPDDSPSPALAAGDLGRSRLDVIRERGSLRVGYPHDRLPFVYRNNMSEVVGSDAALVHEMAADLGVTLEFSRLERDAAYDALETGAIDMMVGGISGVPETALKATLSRSYGSHTAGFLVKDHERSRFSSLAKMRGRTDLTIAIPGTRLAQHSAAVSLPGASLTKLPSPRPFVRGEAAEVDALLMSAEAAGAWTLIYPQFSVAVPSDLSIKIPVAIALPRGQGDWLNYVDSWLGMAEGTGMIRRLHARWILGRDLGGDEPRWSILHDVIGVERDPAPPPVDE
jgi:Na+/H+-dicarboxylate symporter